jgi:hypothetical protein
VAVASFGGCGSFTPFGGGQRLCPGLHLDDPHTFIKWRLMGRVAVANFWRRRLLHPLWCRAEAVPRLEPDDLLPLYLVINLRAAPGDLL